MIPVRQDGADGEELGSARSGLHCAAMTNGMTYCRGPVDMTEVQSRLVAGRMKEIQAFLALLRLPVSAVIMADVDPGGRATLHDACVRQGLTRLPYGSGRTHPPGRNIGNRVGADAEAAGPDGLRCLGMQ